jgi:SAM-dependent methyltransferase
MPDIYTRVTQAPPQILAGLMTALELRAADPQLRAMLHTYLTDVALPQGARVLEVGCGTGAVTRALATWPGVGETIGVDPSPVFLARARQLAAELPSVAFEESDGRSLPFAGSTFDAVVFHTTLCHVPGPEIMLHEAVRVLRPAGAWRYLKATTPLARWRREPKTRWTPAPRRFASTSCMIPGWHGVCRRWCGRPAWTSSVCAASATWKRPHPASCCPAGSIWERMRSWPRDGWGRTWRQR